MAEVLVFAGPCLSRLDGARRAELFPAGTELRPPARRGDLLSAMAEKPHTLVLLDGYFFHELSVAHKELLYALEAGVRVIGAASMGALRAAEMARFGMIGVGTVFQWFSDGVLEGDDEVTVLHLPEGDGYRVITVALVELRHALQGLVALRVCDGESADALLRAVEVLAFSERSPDLVDRLAREHLGVAGARSLSQHLDSFSLKEHDAELAMSLAQIPPEGEERRSSDRSIFLNYWCEDHLRVPTITDSLPREATLMQAWNTVQLFHDGAPEFVARLRLRYLAASAAEHAGLEVDPTRRRAVFDELTRHTARNYGGPVLPEGEVEREAYVQAACEVACGAFGGPEAAGDWLAAEYGLDARDGHTQLIELLSTQYGLQTSWALVRSFAFSSALRPALELAAAAAEVTRCFQIWSEGARIGRDDLVQLAAELWHTSPEEVTSEGSRRGLLEAHGFSEGLREVLQRVAPAERLPRPINDYPERKASLRTAPLAYALELFPRVKRGGAVLRPRERPTTFDVLGAGR